MAGETSGASLDAESALRRYYGIRQRLKRYEVLEEEGCGLDRNIDDLVDMFSGVTTVASRSLQDPELGLRGNYFSEISERLERNKFRLIRRQHRDMRHAAIETMGVQPCVPGRFEIMRKGDALGASNTTPKLVPSISKAMVISNATGTSPNMSIVRSNRSSQLKARHHDKEAIDDEIDAQLNQGLLRRKLLLESTGNFFDMVEPPCFLEMMPMISDLELSIHCAISHQLIGNSFLERGQTNRENEVFEKVISNPPSNTVKKRENIRNRTLLARMASSSLTFPENYGEKSVQKLGAVTSDPSYHMREVHYKALLSLLRASEIRNSFSTVTSNLRQ